MIHPGKVFEDWNSFDTYGVGAMKWSYDPDGTRVLWFRAPDNDCARIYTTRDDEYWCKGGRIVGWDGNVERPTFTPSIWLREKRGWHGFITNGDLHDA